MRPHAPIALACLLLTGCPSFSLGPTAGAAIGRGTTPPLGAALSVRSHFESEGLFFGAEQRFGSLPSPNEALLWRSTFLAGYSVIPLPYRSRVGFESALRIGAGSAPRTDRRPVAFVLGSVFALPIRVSPDKRPAQTDGLLTTSWEIVPSLTNDWFFADRVVPTTEIGGTLSLRLQLWSGISP